MIAEGGKGGSNCVVLSSVTKRFGEVTAVDAIDLEIEEGEFFTMLGPSGCGKTTTLRMIAGFEEVTEGRLTIDDADMLGIPPHKRPTNTVFQSYALFPHLSVRENVAFGLQRKGADRADRPAGARGARAGGPGRGGRTAGPRSSPAGCSSASRLPGRWSTCRGSCCWTSRSAPST